MKPLCVLVVAVCVVVSGCKNYYSVRATTPVAASCLESCMLSHRSADARFTCAQTCADTITDDVSCRGVPRDTTRACIEKATPNTC